MLRITCCRCGTSYRVNRHGKGQFVKEFKDLSDFARWWVKSRSKIYFPNIRKELSNRQKVTLLRKISSLEERNHND